MSYEDAKAARAAIEAENERARKAYNPDTASDYVKNTTSDTSAYDKAAADHNAYDRWLNTILAAGQYVGSDGKVHDARTGAVVGDAQMAPASDSWYKSRDPADSVFHEGVNRTALDYELVQKGLLEHRDWLIAEKDRQKNGQYVDSQGNVRTTKDNSIIGKAMQHYDPASDSPAQMKADATLNQWDTDWQNIWAWKYGKVDSGAAPGTSDSTALLIGAGAFLGSAALFYYNSKK